MVGYYRAFCRNFFTVVAPLTDLLKSSVKIVWAVPCQVAFENVKTLLCAAPVLTAPRLEEPFKLEVDASHVGAGAVLLQEWEQVDLLITSQKSLTHTNSIILRLKKRLWHCFGPSSILRFMLGLEVAQWWCTLTTTP